jgi:hypothetical protein
MSKRDNSDCKKYLKLTDKLVNPEKWPTDPEEMGKLEEGVFFHAFGTTNKRPKNNQDECRPCIQALRYIDAYPAGCTTPLIGFRLTAYYDLIKRVIEEGAKLLPIAYIDHLSKCGHCYLEARDVTEVMGLSRERYAKFFEDHKLP